MNKREINKMMMLRLPTIPIIFARIEIFESILKAMTDTQLAEIEAYLVMYYRPKYQKAFLDFMNKKYGVDYLAPTKFSERGRSSKIIGHNKGKMFRKKGQFIDIEINCN